MAPTSYNEFLEKQISESFVIAGDFVNVLETGETISLAGSSVAAEDCNGADKTDDVLVDGSKEVDGTKLKIKVKAGTEAESPYKITFYAITSNNNKWELDVYMKVKER